MENGIENRWILNSEYLYFKERRIFISAFSIASYCVWKEVFVGVRMLKLGCLAVYQLVC